MSKQQHPGPRFSRRALLGGTMAALAGAMGSRFGLSSIAQAQSMAAQNTRRFIFCYFPGGWDQLLFLDPRDPARFTEDTRGSYLTDVRYGQLDGQQGFVGQPITSGNLTFGPASEKPAQTTPKLSQYGSRIALVRGLYMGTVAHEVGYRYFLTGKFPAGNAARGTSIPVDLAAKMQAATALPVLSLQVESYNDRYPGNYNAMQVNSIDDLLMVLARGSDLTERDAIEAALDQYAHGSVPCDVNVYDRRGLLSSMRGMSDTAQSLLTQNLAQRFQFVTDPTVPANADATTRAAIVAIQMRNARIRAQYGIPVGQSNSPAARAALAALAIKEGITQCASVTIGGSTDTHFTNNLDHANRLYPGVAALSSLLDDLATSDAPAALGGKWLDHTTILAFSEFSRTPLMNQFGGRDHHICNSCLIAGAGIRGNTVVGQSSEVAMGSATYDFSAQRLSDTGVTIGPEHIAATLMASANLDYSITRVEPLRALLAP